MKVHEYQAKEILKEFGVPVPKGQLATAKEEARMAAISIDGDLWVVKAQVHSGGRGKAGGVKVCKTVEEVQTAAADMLGMTLVTHQTGPEGKLVRKVYIEQGSNISEEYYLGITLDRDCGQDAIIASAEGGVEIEKVAEETPEEIIKECIDPAVGLMPYQARKLAFKLGFKGKEVGQVVKILLKLYKAYQAKDCSLAEINPLVKTAEGNILAVDAKMNFDDNALFRQREIVEMRDFEEEDPLEVEASKYDLNYVNLDGNVGCMVNGAGLAMATMDMIKLAGGDPANFLDVGGGASTERVANAFKILMTDDHIRVVLINIFGGIVRCDIVAQGVVEALKIVRVDVPVVVRLDGTNAKEGKELLGKTDLNIVVADGLKDAAEKAVSVAKGH